MSERPAVERRGARQAADGVLCRGWRSTLGRGACRRDRAVVDDPPALRRPGAHQPEPRRQKRHRWLTSTAFAARPPRRPRRATGAGSDAGVVEQQVEAAEALADGVEQRRDRFLARHVVAIGAATPFRRRPPRRSPPAARRCAGRNTTCRAVVQQRRRAALPMPLPAPVTSAIRGPGGWCLGRHRRPRVCWVSPVGRPGGTPYHDPARPASGRRKATVRAGSTRSRRRSAGGGDGGCRRFLAAARRKCARSPPTRSRPT